MAAACERALVGHRILVAACALVLLAAPANLTAAESESGVDQTREGYPETRLVWVLTATLTMSEAGPVPGAPEVLLYQFQCTDRRLRSYRRTYKESHPVGATAMLAIRLRQSPLTAEGAAVLAARLEGMC